MYPPGVNKLSHSGLMLTPRLSRTYFCLQPFESSVYEITGLSLSFYFRLCRNAVRSGSPDRGCVNTLLGGYASDMSRRHSRLRNRKTPNGQASLTAVRCGRALKRYSSSRLMLIPRLSRTCFWILPFESSEYHFIGLPECSSTSSIQFSLPWSFMTSCKWLRELSSARGDLGRPTRFLRIFLTPPRPALTAVFRSRIRTSSSMNGKGKRSVCSISIPFSRRNGIDRTHRFERAWRTRTSTALCVSGCSGFKPIARVDSS